MRMSYLNYISGLYFRDGRIEISQQYVLINASVDIISQQREREVIIDNDRRTNSAQLHDR